METKWVQFTATVPEWALSDLSRHVADVTAQAAARERAAGETFEDGVRRSMALIKTADGARFVDVLARLCLDSSAGWVDWSALCSAMEMDAHRLSGVLGGIGKATKDAPRLYERDKVEGGWRFRMDRVTAETVLGR